MKEFKHLGFDKEETTELVDKLNLLLANLNVHYQKLRNYHWNVKGGEFFDVHEIMEEEYTEVATEIDEIAERIRVFGATPISTMQGYLDTAEIEETGTDLSSTEMIEEVLRDFGLLFSFMIEIVEASSKLGDISTDDLVTGFMKRREKKHWMLSAFIAED